MTPALQINELQNTVPELQKLLGFLDKAITITTHSMGSREALFYITKLSTFPHATTLPEERAVDDEVFAFDTLKEVTYHLQEARKHLYVLGIKREENPQTEGQTI
jgi:hypothetical protein